MKYFIWCSMNFIYNNILYYYYKIIFIFKLKIILFFIISYIKVNYINFIIKIIIFVADDRQPPTASICHCRSSYSDTFKWNLESLSPNLWKGITIIEEWAFIHYRSIIKVNEMSVTVKPLCRSDDNDCSDTKY